MAALSALQSRAADSISVCRTDLRSKADRLMTCSTSEVAVCCSRLFQFSSESCDLFFEIGRGWARRFVTLGPSCAPPLRGLSACTPSLHVAPMTDSRRGSILGKSSGSRHGRMSALGQKQTCAAHKLTSALPPKATSNATVHSAEAKAPSVWD